MKPSELSLVCQTALKGWHSKEKHPEWSHPYPSVYYSCTAIVMSDKMPRTYQERSELENSVWPGQGPCAIHLSFGPCHFMEETRGQQGHGPPAPIGFPCRMRSQFWTLTGEACRI